MDPNSSLYNYHSPLGRSHFNRITAAEKQRREYLGEINQMIDETEFIVTFGKRPPPPLPVCLRSPKSKNTIAITPAESLSQEEIDRFINEKVKTLTPKRPLRPIHYTKRTESALLNSPTFNKSKLRLSQTQLSLDQIPTKRPQLELEDSSEEDGL